MKNELTSLNTETRNPNSMNIDELETHDILTIINKEDEKVAGIVGKQIPAIEQLINHAFVCLKNGGRIIYIGAGTSGRLGVLDASECPPTYGVSFDLIQGHIAGGMSALLKAKEGAEDSKELCVEDLKEIGLTSKDCLIGLAASGRTPYVIGGLEYANAIGATTGSVCCVENAEISKHAKYPIEVVTGAEVVTGSTRMKAGTAQKLVLNMISTTCMIKYGKVYQNLMVDVQATNQKLVTRAKGIIKEALGCSDDKAKSLFEASEHDVKLAIIMGITNKDRVYAKQKLEMYDGNVSKTIRELLKED